MMRQCSNRSQRSKKLKMKYALQLFILLAISIWLLYQLKHTFEKKNSLDARTHDSEKNPNSIGETKLQEKVSILGRKDLPENINSINREVESDIDEEDEEEKDRELDQLLEDGDARENNGEEEYGANGEEGEDVEIDDNISSYQLSISNKNESNNANIGLEDNAKGSLSNQSISLESYVNQENYNKTENFERKDEIKLEKSSIAKEELHENSRASNSTVYLFPKVDSSRNETNQA